MTSVFEQVGVPVIEIMRASAKWVTEQIVSRQPGAYLSQRGHFETVYGHATSAEVTVDAYTDTATYRVSCQARQPDGTIRTYLITVSVTGDAGNVAVPAPSPDPDGSPA